MWEFSAAPPPSPTWRPWLLHQLFAGTFERMFKMKLCLKAGISMQPLLVALLVESKLKRFTGFADCTIC